jgi:hypothetical protein
MACQTPQKTPGTPRHTPAHFYHFFDKKRARPCHTVPGYGTPRHTILQSKFGGVPTVPTVPYVPLLWMRCSNVAQWRNISLHLIELNGKWWHGRHTAEKQQMLKNWRLIERTQNTLIHGGDWPQK